MLVSVERLIGSPVLSLQTGQSICTIEKVIIDPNNFCIAAFYVRGRGLAFQPAVLFAQDIREYAELGAIVDSIDNIVSPRDMVRLNQVISLRFEVIGLKVFTEDGTKLGKVSDCVVNTINYDIEQVRVQPGLWASLATTGLIVHRNQIIRLEPDRLIVASTKIANRRFDSVIAKAGSS